MATTPPLSPRSLSVGTPPVTSLESSTWNGWEISIGLSEQDVHLPLPHDMSLAFFSFSDLPTLSAVRQSCKAWYHLVGDNPQLKAIFQLLLTLNRERATNKHLPPPSLLLESVPSVADAIQLTHNSTRRDAWRQKAVLTLVNQEEVLAAATTYKTLSRWASSILTPDDPCSSVPYRVEEVLDHFKLVDCTTKDKISSLLNKKAPFACKYVLLKDFFGPVWSCERGSLTLCCWLLPTQMSDEKLSSYGISLNWAEQHKQMYSRVTTTEVLFFYVELGKLVDACAVDQLEDLVYKQKTLRWCHVLSAPFPDKSTYESFQDALDRIVDNLDTFSYSRSSKLLLLLSRIHPHLQLHAVREDLQLTDLQTLIQEVEYHAGNVSDVPCNLGQTLPFVYFLADWLVQWNKALSPLALELLAQYDLSPSDRHAELQKAVKTLKWFQASVLELMTESGEQIASLKEEYPPPMSFTH